MKGRESNFAPRLAILHYLSEAATPSSTRQVTTRKKPFFHARGVLNLADLVIEMTPKNTNLGGNKNT